MTPETVPPRITYLFRAGRRGRLGEPGAYPTEFFYGYVQLAARGFDVRLVEDAEVGMGPPLPPLARFVNRASGLAGGLPLGMALNLITSRGTRRLDDAGLVVATTNGMGLSLAFAKAIGDLRVPVLLIAMGVLPIRPGVIQRTAVAALSRHIHLACISRNEREFLQRLMPGRLVHYIPFGVDADYWRPGGGDGGDGDYVLAIGNDPHRDWATLVRAWSLDLPPLKIVTNLPVPAAPANVEVVCGDWRKRLLTDNEVRDLYRRALFMVVPVRDTMQPSGQSACLQAMACGKPVVLSDMAGLWEPDLMRHGENVLLVRPGDAGALSDAAHRLAKSAELRVSLGRGARHVIESDLNTDAMAKSFAAVFRSISN